MTNHNPTRCAELVKEARERCKPQPMEQFPSSECALISELADQLEAANAEVERLRKLGNEVACALGVEGESDAVVAHTAWEACGLVMAGVTVRTERDALTAERDALRAENERLRSTVTAFCEAVDAADRALERRGQGGQQVPFHGDFCAATPSVMSRLRWWAREMKRVASGDV